MAVLLRLHLPKKAEVHTLTEKEKAYFRHLHCFLRSMMIPEVLLSLVFVCSDHIITAQEREFCIYIVFATGQGCGGFHCVYPSLYRFRNVLN